MISIKRIGVAGAGAMGAGIGQIFAQFDHEVVLFDTDAGQLDKARAEINKNLDISIVKGKLTEAGKAQTLGRISFSGNIESLKGDLLVEAIVEKAEVKRELFLKLSEINTPETILATNTSSIPVTRIAKGISNPQRIVGMHFFNPAHLMKLVEVISGEETSKEVMETIKQICIAIGKTPIICKDSPGFIVNRVARHYYLESLRLLEEKNALIEDIDALMESAGFKMGPFRLMDYVGNDINLAVTSSLFDSFHQEPKFRPSRIQEQKVSAGHLGKKTGRGFYIYK